MSPRSPSSVVANRVQQIESNLSDKKTAHSSNLKQSGGKRAFGILRPNNNVTALKMEKDEHTQGTFSSEEIFPLVDRVSSDSLHSLDDEISPEKKNTATDSEENLRRRVIYFDLDMDKIEDTAKTFVEEGGHLLDQILHISNTEPKEEEPDGVDRNLEATQIVDSRSPVNSEALVSGEDIVNSSLETDLRRRVIYFDLDPEEIPDIDEFQALSRIDMCGSPRTIPLDDAEDPQSTVPTEAKSNVSSDHPEMIKTEVEVVLNQSSVSHIPEQNEVVRASSSLKFTKALSKHDSVHIKPTQPFAQTDDSTYETVPTSPVMARIRQIESNKSSNHSDSARNNKPPVGTVIGKGKAGKHGWSTVASSSSSGRTSNSIYTAPVASADTSSLETGAGDSLSLQVIVVDNLEGITQERGHKPDTYDIVTSTAEKEQIQVIAPAELTAQDKTAVASSGNQNIESNTPIKTTITGLSLELVESAVPDAIASSGVPSDSTVEISVSEELRRRVIYFDLELEEMPDIVKLQDLSRIDMCGSPRTIPLEESTTPVDATTAGISIEGKAQLEASAFVESAVPDAIASSGVPSDSTVEISVSEELRRRVIYFDLDLEEMPDIVKLQDLPRIDMCGSPRTIPLDDDDDDDDDDDSEVSQAKQSGTESNGSSSDSESEDEDASTLSAHVDSSDKTGILHYSFLSCPMYPMIVSSHDSNQESSMTLDEPWNFWWSTDRDSSALNGLIDSLRSDQGSRLTSSYKMLEDDKVEQTNIYSTVDDDDSVSSAPSKASIHNETSIGGILDAIRSSSTKHDYTKESLDDAEVRNKYGLKSDMDKAGKLPKDYSDVTEKSRNSESKSEVSDNREMNSLDLLSSVFYSGAVVSSTNEYPSDKYDLVIHDNDKEQKKKIASRYDDDYSVSDLESDDEPEKSAFPPSEKEVECKAVTVAVCTNLSNASSTDARQEDLCKVSSEVNGEATAHQGSEEKIGNKKEGDVLQADPRMETVITTTLKMPPPVVREKLHVRSIAAMFEQKSEPKVKAGK